MAAGGRQWGGEGGEVGMGLAVGMAMRTWGWGHGAGSDHGDSNGDTGLGTLGWGHGAGSSHGAAVGTWGWVQLWGSSGDMGLGPAMGTAIGTQG